MNLNTAGWASRTLTPLLRIIRGATNTTVPVIAISEPVNSETAALVNADIAIVAKGTGATLAQVPDGTAAGGNRRGIYATDWQKTRGIATQAATSSYSTIGGGDSNTANGTYATIAGGGGNAASAYAAIAGGLGNTASSTYSFVGGGQSNTAQTSTHATVCGGSNNTASGQYSFVGSGQQNTVSGLNASVVGGELNTASGSHSFISGGYRGWTRGITGYHVFPACLAPVALGAGVTQSALLLLGRQTTDATATVLASNSSPAGTTNQVILPNNSAYYFRGSVIAGVTGAGDSKAWTFEGAIKRGANAASTAIVGTVVLNTIAQDTGAAAWTVAITADTTNGGIAVTVTGAAATTIRWVAKIETTEMTY